MVTFTDVLGLQVHLMMVSVAEEKSSVNTNRKMKSSFLPKVNSFKFIMKKITILILCIILFQLGIYEDQTFHLESNRNKIDNEFSIMADSIFVFYSSPIVSQISTHTVEVNYFKFIRKSNAREDILD